MSMKLITAALMASALIASPAMAQSNPPAKPSPPAASSKPVTAVPSAVTTAQKPGEWRGSKLVGLNVYNASDDKIGSINELIMSEAGKVDVVVIGVGGFLGIGEHNVGLAWDKVKWVNEAPKTKSSATSTRPRPMTTGSASTAKPVTVKEYPDHAVVDMSKDQLKALPAFKYASDTSKPGSGAGSTAPAAKKDDKMAPKH